MAEDIQAVIDKAIKLMSLANNNPNENESQAAMLKCQELLARHHLDMKALEEATHIQLEAGEEEIHLTTKRSDWAEELIRIVTKNFRCKWYYMEKNTKIIQKEYIDHKTASGYNEYWKEFIHYVVYGLKLDREMCAAVFKAAQYSIEVLSKGVKGKKIDKESYRLGFVHGLGEKFEAQRKNMDQSMALILVTPDEVFDYARKLRLTAGKSLSVSYNYGDAYQSGKLDGKAWETNSIKSNSAYPVGQLR